MQGVVTGEKIVLDGMSERVAGIDSVDPDGDKKQKQREQAKVKARAEHGASHQTKLLPFAIKRSWIDAENARGFVQIFGNPQNAADVLGFQVGNADARSDGNGGIGLRTGKIIG
jgi:hypothetical protein